MTLKLKTSGLLLSLHGSVGLTDWDLDKELKLATLSDWFYLDEKLDDEHVAQKPSGRVSRRKDDLIWYDKASDTLVKPNPWLLVNPNIVCPLQYREKVAVHPVPQKVPVPPTKPAKHQRPLVTKLNVLAPRKTPVRVDHLLEVSSNSMIKDISAAKTMRKKRAPKVLDRKCVTLGGWPRPPVNYSILIALALKSSQAECLKVQQIYNFTRDHFPFFQTAPDGWKNTIRHNLCFNSSFRKTCNQLCKDGKRQSCFWHLTPEGHLRLHDELGKLTGEPLRLLQRSMSRPDIIRSLLSL
ncbi:forkhead box protein R1 [Synchiropus picturatus]